MKPNSKKVFTLFIAIMMFAALLTDCGLSVDNDIKENSSAKESTPTKIPVFSLKDMQGNTVTEAIFRKNKLTLVNVWATTCSPCMDEMPDLENLSQDYSDKDIGFLGFAADGNDAAPQAKKSLQELGITYTNLLPNDDFTNRFLNRQDMVGGENLPISRAYRKEVRQKHLNFISWY